jgi:oxygen-dependent protoporphyrinogen oxidase
MTGTLMGPWGIPTLGLALVERYVVAKGTEQEPFDAVVIGAGLAGLAAAYVLTRQGLSVSVLERDRVTGGRARSKVVDGTTIDLGAQFISGFYKATLELLDELGISDELATRSQQAYVVRDSAPRGLWPLSLLIKDTALSFRGKVRLATLAPPLICNWRRLDITKLDRAKSLDCQSTSEYVLGHIGSDGLEFFFGPLLRALLYWEPQTTTLPVVLAALKAVIANRAVYRLRDGISRIAETLATHYPVTCDSEVKAVHSRSGKGPFEIEATVAGVQTTVWARTVVCATQASVANELLPWLPLEVSGFLQMVSYSSTMMFTYRIPAHIADYPKGALLFPLTEKELASINPLYIYDQEDKTSSRFVNVLVSDTGYRHFDQLSDEAASARVLARVRKLVGFDWIEKTELVNVQRWKMALPRFDVGYIKAVSEFERAQQDVPDIAFAGDYLGGPFVDGAIRSGQAAAVHILRQHAQ